jgi:hypothetical protein
LINDHYLHKVFVPLISSGLHFIADVVDKQLAVPSSNVVFFVLNIFNRLKQILDQETIRELDIFAFEVLFPSFNQLFLFERGLVLLSVGSKTYHPEYQIFNCGNYFPVF